ncbi:MAG TPA: hypothetical protein VFN29_03770, partial [Chiayiivirga sp.]|nr:hypothetical protein [Chiayiivirga sp.]
HGGGREASSPKSGAAVSDARAPKSLDPVRERVSRFGQKAKGRGQSAIDFSARRIPVWVRSSRH